MLNRKRRCKAKNKRGEPCGFSPLVDNDLCWAHDPENEAAAQEARRVGGIRRKRESTLAGAFDFTTIEAEGALVRLTDIAVFDALALDPSMNKVRTLVAVIQVAEKVLKVRELEERVADIESVMGERLAKGKRR